MIRYNLLIKFKTGEDKVVTGVSNYGVYKDEKVFYYVKNGYTSYIPIDTVIFFGREFDYLED